MTQLPMFPLGCALLPGEYLPLRIFEPRYREMFADRIAADDLRFGVVLIERGSEVGGGDERADVGTIAEVVEHRPSGGGGWALLCRGVERIRVDEWLDDAPYPRARVSEWPDPPLASETWEPLLTRLEGASAELVAFLRDYARDYDPDLRIPQLPDAQLPPAEYAYATARSMPITQSDRHRALCAPDAGARAHVLIEAIGDAHAGLQFRLT